MNPYPHEPLTPEERELAQLTSRLPPHGEPSPALDARILAAAHAAAAPQPVRKHKPRWPVALGLAASVVFAVGIAWQLRPLQEQGALLTEAPASPDAAEQAAPVANVAAAPEAFPQAADAMAASEPAAGQTAREQAKAVAAPPTDVGARNRSQTAPLPAKEAVAAREVAAQRQQVDRYTPPSPPSPPAPAPPPPPAAAMVMSPAPVVLAAPVPPPEASLPLAEEAEAAEAEATLDEVSVVVAERSAAKARTDNTRRKVAQGREANVRSVPPPAPSNATQDRVEVSGSRLRTDLQVPVVDDTHLAVNDWLERVRTRYGLGDAAAARQSLLLFVRDHPRENVPDDLEPLLKE